VGRVLNLKVSLGVRCREDVKGEFDPVIAHRAGGELRALRADRRRRGPANASARRTNSPAVGKAGRTSGERLNIGIASGAHADGAGAAESGGRCRAGVCPDGKIVKSPGRERTLSLYY